MTENPRLDHPISVLGAATKSVIHQSRVVAQSVEQRTENPRVLNSVLTPVNMNFKGSDLIGAFFISAFRSSSGFSGVHPSQA